MSALAMQGATAFFTTIFLLVALAKLGPSIGLADSPDWRKRHEGSIPIVGGIAIFLTLAASAVAWVNHPEITVLVRGEDGLWVFLGCSALLVITGALDDLYDLGVAVRVGSEILVALLVIELLGLKLVYLGDLLSLGRISLNPFLAYPFTVIAIFGLINAFNMLDGIDGLLASLVLTTLIIFHFFTETEPGTISLVIGFSLAAFLVSNMQLSPHIPKTFLGDAGSRLLGFLVVCLLLAAASGQVGDGKIIKPVTALFLVAIPLFDMVFITLRRVILGGSPFAPDRTHIHHLMLGLGLSDRRALVLIVAISLSMNFLGLMLHRSAVPEYHQLAIFLACFSLYCLVMSQAWIVAKKMEHKIEQVLDNDSPPKP